MIETDWHEITVYKVPPMGSQVLLRRKPTNYVAGATYFVGCRNELRAPYMRPLGWEWRTMHGKKLTAKHLTHFAYITEPTTK